MSAEIQGRREAESFRASHNLGILPLGDMVATIELSRGIDVAILDAGPDQHGMAVRDPERNVVFIGAAKTPHPMRQRSTLAHELAHVLFEDYGTKVSSERTLAEIRADAFARHLLVPLEWLKDAYEGHSLSTFDLSDVVQRFLASPNIVAIQFKQTGLIDEQTHAEWAQQSASRLATRFGWRDQ